MKTMTNNIILSKTKHVLIKGRSVTTKISLTTKEEGLYVVPSSWVRCCSSIVDEEGTVLYQAPSKPKAKVAKPAIKQPAAVRHTVEVSF